MNMTNKCFCFQGAGPSTFLRREIKPTLLSMPGNAQSISEFSQLNILVHRLNALVVSKNRELES